MAAKARTLTLKTKVEVTGADKLNNLGKKLKGVGTALTVGLTAPIVGIGSAMVQAALDAEASEARFKNVFRGMNAAAWTSIDTLDAHAQALADATAFDDDEIRDLQGTLLTFGNITGDAFEGATEAALDMAQFFEGGASDAAIQLGKALNSPKDGLSALKRVGVSFTDSQIEQVKRLQSEGNIAAAQGVILDELARQFGGAAETFAETGAGQMKQAMNELGEASEAFGEAIVPVVRDIAGAVKDFAKWLQELNPETRTWILRIAGITAVVGPAALVVGNLVSGYAALVKLAPAVGLAWPKLVPPIAVGLAIGALKDQIHELVNPDGPSFEEMFAAAIGAPRDALEEMTDAQWDAVEESGNAWAEQRNIISDAIYGTGGMVPTIEAGADAMAEEMGEAPGKMADELLAAQFRLTDATSQLVAFMEQAISPAQEMMELQGFLASNELANGLASNNPLIVQKSQEMRDAALSRLAELQGQAWTYGNNVGTSFAAGMNAAYGWVRTAAGNLAAAARNQIGINSEPNDPRSPLYGITKWGGNIARTLAAGMTSGISTVQGAAARLAGAAVIGPGSLVAATAPIAGGGGGTTIINNNFSFVGVEAGGPNELSTLLQRLSSVSSGSVRYG